MTIFSKLGPLNWQVPIVDQDRRPTPEFSRYFAQLFGNDTNLLTTLGDKVNKTTQVIAGVGLTGGGDLSADRTFNIDLTAEAERIRDVIGTALVAGTGIGIAVNDAGDTITISNTATAYTDEMARDAVGAALVAGSGIGIVVNDALDTITISNTQTAYTDEMARDAIGTALVAGANITITVNDVGDTITIASTGGSATSYRPMVTGDDPAVLIINVDHDIIMTEI